MISLSLILFLALIWGSSFILIKIGLIAFSPEQLALLRMLFAGLALLPIMVKYRHDTSLKQLAFFAFIGLIGNFLPAWLFAVAQKHIPSSLAGMLNSLQPMMTLLFAGLLFHQHINHRQIVGVVIGLVGAILLIVKPEQQWMSQIGLWGFSGLVIFAVMCYSLASNIVKVYLHDQPSEKITAFALGCYLPFSFTLLIIDSPNWQQVFSSQLPSFIAIALLGVLGTSIAVIMYFKLIQKTDAIVASSITYLIPIVAIFWGSVDGETVSNLQLVGILLVMLALSIIHARAPRKGS